PSPREAAGPWPSKCVAIDCEMVGTGPRGRVSELARCSVVSYHGDVLYDKYIRPELPIVDYRTRWSGITRQHMRKAIPFQVAQKEILKLLKGKVVVGHALHNDFQALKYGHSSVEDALTAMELYRLVEVQWEQQEASSASAPPEDRSSDVEKYMEDQYWPEDLVQASLGGTREAP
uniref:Exonuclease domain-containing protein n=1 Tax=Jaculus jaculus TaxID=51337 RepID=A0A8C5LI68_JACJA